MTTVAFDGVTMAADSLAVGVWGLTEVADKIWVGENVLIGCAGESGAINRWLVNLPNEVTMPTLIGNGYAFYNKDHNDPHILVVDRSTKKIFKHAGGSFLPCSRSFMAIGSGRDYAIAAMHLGKSAGEAVEVAMVFDNNTGGKVNEVAA